MEYLGQDRREGLGRKANSQFGLLLLLLVSGLLLLSSLYSAQASVFKKARESVVDVTSPILQLFAEPIAAINDAVGQVSDYFNVLEQNKALREENAQLRQWMNEAIELRRTVSQFNELQSYAAPPEATPIDAFIIGESGDAFGRSMIVNAGRGRNVEAGQAVVDDAGFVGRIVDAGVRASRVLLLTDSQSRVPVYVEGADVEGILVGNSKDRPTISFTQNSEPREMIPGQRVLTSGAGGVLPRGIPVGEIKAAQGQESEVDLFSNYARTRIVRIINYEFPLPTSGDDVLDVGESEDAVEIPANDAAASEAVQETADQPASAATPEG